MVVRQSSAKDTSQGGILGRTTEVWVGLTSKTVHGGPGTLPAENLLQKSFFQRSLQILPVEGNRAPLLQPAQRCRAAAVSLMTSCSPVPSPGYPLASRSSTLAFRQPHAWGQPRALYWPRHLLRSEDEQRLYPLAAQAFLFLKLGSFALGM